MNHPLATLTIFGDRFPDSSRYPFSIPALSGRKQLQFQEAVVYFVGENGSGKSTLLRALARRCGLDLWSQGERALRPGELQSAALVPYLEVAGNGRPIRGAFFSADTFRNWAEFLADVTAIDPGQAKYHGDADLTARSRGEGILTYFRARYKFPGLYFLDEPESALSPASQLELLGILHEYQTRGEAQFVIATHSPILMALPEAQVFVLSHAGIQESPFESTAHFRLYRDFLADPAAFLPRRPD